MKIYVAGAWTHRESLHRLMTILEEMGHTITHDWTHHELEYNDFHERSKRCAEADIDGVLRSDLVLAVMTEDDYAYKGTRHELGATFVLRHLHSMGLTQTSPIVWIVSNCDPRTDNINDLPGCMRCCFEHLADEYFRNIDDAVKKLRDIV